MSSMIFRYPPLHTVLSALEASEVVTDCCAFQTKKFGERHLKQFKVAFTGGDWGFGIRRKCKCPGGQHVALMQRTQDGKVSGTKMLKESQAYPPKFGETVVASWLDPPCAAQEADIGKGTCRTRKRPASSQPTWMQPSGSALDTSASASKRSKRSQCNTGNIPAKASWMTPIAG